MDWSNERYVRLYTRDTTTWKLLDWRARTVLLHLLRKVDRAGVLDVGDDGVLGLAAVLELPLDVVDPGITQLTTSRGSAVPTVVATGTAFVMPRFLDAQEAPQSDAQRARESRARRRDRVLAESRFATPESQTVTAPPGSAHGRHENREAVTPTLPSLPIRSEEDLSPARAIARGTEPGTARSAWHDRRRWWNAMQDADARIKASGIEPNAPAFPPNFAGENERNLAACARQLEDAGYDAATVDAKMHHIVLVAEAEAMREGHRRWFKPALIWDPERANRAVDTPLEEARRPRLIAGPGKPAVPAARPDRGPKPVVVPAAARAEAAALLAEIDLDGPEHEEPA